MAEEKQEKQDAKDSKPQHGRRQGQQISGAASIVRVAGKDMDGGLNMPRALSKIKGISHNMAHAIALTAESRLNIPQSTKVGSLTEDQVEEVEKIIKDPASAGVPLYLLNKNKDMETGRNMHIVSNDLVFSTKQDISREVNVGTWRGYRHQYGQRVRGQRTRSTGRTGATVGVIKKKEGAPTQAAAAAGAQAAQTASKEIKKEKAPEKKT